LLPEEIKALPLDDFLVVLEFWIGLELVMIFLEDAAIEIDFAFAAAVFGLAFALDEVEEEGFLEKKLKSVPCFFAELVISIDDGCRQQ
jgi:hypothetical protein